MKEQFVTRRKQRTTGAEAGRKTGVTSGTAIQKLERIELNK
jgi:hypothetical protein